jgi:MoaA/NifB/PqqE/SkfB family radical SAM enzyme/protein-L-isoaspartate O-methyltransferase
MRGDEFFKKVAKKEPFTGLHPAIAVFFKDYLSHEKVIQFNDQFIVNTHFPPYPSVAFDNLAEYFDKIGQSEKRHLYSVTFAVTNRCNYNCWHCYNAGRSQEDIPFSIIERVIAELRELGAVIVTLTGGEPLLRNDLEDMVSLFDDRTCLILGTTGEGLTRERSRALKKRGLFGVGFSLDSSVEKEHDQMRGVKGAFKTALNGINIASDAGLYPYIVSVATHKFLKRDRFMSFMQFASNVNAREVHLLEPCATGRLAGRSDVLLTYDERQLIFEYQEEIALSDNLPILSSYTYLESPEAFGCGAGLTHLYIDGSGEVCPCNLIPISFGNIANESLSNILGKMGCHFQKPRTCCVGRTLRKEIPAGHLPTNINVSLEICKKYLPKKHAVPNFFHIKDEAFKDVGKEELRLAYNKVHDDYDEFWLTEAAKPIDELIKELRKESVKKVFEAGCGTGYATALLADVFPSSTEILAADISEAMLSQARRRVGSKGYKNVKFISGDALEILEQQGPFDIIFLSWVLGYIPLKLFFSIANYSLREQGQLAFIVHKQNSPHEALEIFEELVVEDPSALRKRVMFDFPQDINFTVRELNSAGFTVRNICDGQAIFCYNSAEEVLEHLLKSGAGTVFYDAIAPDKRNAMKKRFVELLENRYPVAANYKVIHDYIACIAIKK